MTARKASLKDTMTRVAQLKQETIEKAKKVPGSEDHVKKRMTEYENAKKQHLSA
jgi:hypothetical protein